MADRSAAEAFLRRKLTAQEAEHFDLAGAQGWTYDQLLAMYVVTLCKSANTIPKLIEAGGLIQKERSEAPLATGRKQGAQRQKTKAEKTNERIQAINAGLLKDARKARWTLDDRAEYIEKSLLDEGIKQLNGKPYKASTIKNKITGT